jgi:hypothetical protein
MCRHIRKEAGLSISYQKSTIGNSPPVPVLPVLPALAPPPVFFPIPPRVAVE